MRPIVLTILDGWGYSNEKTGNAIANASTPNLNQIFENYPSMLLQASGPAVGMTFGESGNSEVGHLTLGAGRIIFQYLNRINKAIEKGAFATNPALEEITHHVEKNTSTLHIIGLLTSGAVHAHLSHLVALVAYARTHNLPFKLHLFTDGRDSGLKESPDTLKKLSAAIGGLESLTTLVGRDYAMDRNNNWDRTEAAYNLLTKGTDEPSTDIFKTIESYYAQDLTDAQLKPTVTSEGHIKDGDALIFFNFREDSMRQLIHTFTDAQFDKFPRILPADLRIATMTQYIEPATDGSPVAHVLFPPPAVDHCLSDVLSANGKKHLHIAETEKYAHVTFFFNGLRNAPYDGETDFFIDSLENPVAEPQMRAADIAAKVISELDRDFYDVFIINIANGDILAHLGNLEAAVKGVEAADAAIGMIKQKILEKDGIMLITSDHGNVESMIYKDTGAMETKHDDNPVPFHLIAKEYEKTRTVEEVAHSRAGANGLLVDVAPTVLELAGLPAPDEMTGSSLLKELSI